MQKDVVKITALSSADTVKRFNMVAPPETTPLGALMVNIQAASLPY
jgi:hypothetical protein